MTLKKSLLAVSLSSAWAFSAAAGSCTVGFGWFKNVPVDDFPVSVTLDPMTLDGFSYDGFADQSAGSDLRVKDSDGTLLPHEIENWNPGGRSVVWVKVPHFSSATELTFEWGDESAEAAEGKPWDDNSCAVFHFAASPTLDSAHGNYTDADGAAPVTAMGDLGPYASFNGAATLRRFSSAPTNYYGKITGKFTYSFWVRTSTPNQTYVCQWGSGVDQKAILYGYVSGTFTMYSGSRDHYVGTLPGLSVSLPDSGWHHFAVTYDGATFTSYVDGYEKQKFAVDFAWKEWDHNQTLTIGGNWGAENPFVGDLDEFRMDDVCRSPEWVRACVETQSRSFNAGGLLVKLPPTGAASDLADFPAYVSFDKNSYGNENGAYAESLAGGGGELRVFSTLTGEQLPHEVLFARNDGFHPGQAGVWTLVDRYPPEGLTLRLTFASGNSFDCWKPTSGEPAAEAAKVFAADENLFVWHLNPTGALVDVVNNVRIHPRYGNGWDDDARGYPRGAASPFGPCQGIYCRTNMTQRNAYAVSLPDASVSNVWTLSWWAKTDEYAAPKPETYLLCFGSMDVLSGYGYPNTFRIWNPGTSAVAYGDDGWHFYALTCDGAKIRSYRDGECKETNNCVFDFKMADGVSFDAGGLNLGSSGNTIKDAFIGRLAEVRLETVCRGEDWLKGCAAQRAYRDDGTARTFVPHFAAPGVSVVDGVNSATFSAEISCRAESEALLCWGESDGGDNLSRWDHVVALGTVGEGAVQGTVNNLAAATAVFARLVATNAYGAAWSKTVRAQTPAPRRGYWAEISVGYDGAETLVDFPLCVRLPASLGLPADSSRVVFALMDGTPLAWEAEKWDADGESVAWVKVPALASGTKLRVQWKDSYECGGAWDVNEVWGKDDYARVMHFACRSGSDFAYESSGWGADVVGNSIKSVNTNGVAGDARGFAMLSKSGTYNDVAKDFFDFPRGFTVSLWADVGVDTEGLYKAGEAEYVIKYELAHPSGAPYHQFYLKYSNRQKADGTMEFAFYNNGSSSLAPYFVAFTSNANTLSDLAVYSRITRPGDGWHHYVWSHDGDWFSVYCDGELVRTVYWPFNLSQFGAPGTRMSTNYGSNVSDYNLFYGALDEYRMERVPRSAAWVKATYDNLKPGSAFVSVGSACTIGTTLIVR